MKSLISTLTCAIIATCGTSVSAQDKSFLKPTEEEIAKVKEQLTAMRKRFDNLPKEKREKFIEYAEVAAKLSNSKRVAESMQHCYKAENLFRGHPQISNILGTCYVELRDFKRAEEIFREAAKIDPYNVSIQFNIGEIYFVSGDYTKAIRQFDYIGILTDNKKFAISDIILYKKALSHLALSKDESLNEVVRAGHKNTYEKIYKGTSFDDYSPLYYFLTAADYFHKGDRKQMIHWINRARIIFNNRNTILPWLDTVIEYGMLKAQEELNDKDKTATPNLQK